jgi:hypothetical protein
MSEITTLSHELSNNSMEVTLLISVAFGVVTST